MRGPLCERIEGGQKLHLQHGPIDLLVEARGPGRDAAYEAACARFTTLLEELVAELPLLRRPVRPGDTAPRGPVARRMWEAALPFAWDFHLTPMIAVAGAVADEILDCMCRRSPLTYAFVNNGGDIAIHLGPGERFTSAVVTDPQRLVVGAILEVREHDPVRGLATSGWRGRSLSLGIADAVTALAPSAAEADAAATLIANAVDLPGHPAIRRRPAREVVEDSDLGDLPVVVDVGPLSEAEMLDALERGAARARAFLLAGLVEGAVLALGGRMRWVGEVRDVVGIDA